MLKRRCRDCGDDYITTDAELKSFLERNITVPGTCKKCRKIRRLSDEIKAVKKILLKNGLTTNPKRG